MDWPVVVEVTVPWRDVDGAGHVNNAVYFSYMEHARTVAYSRMTGAKHPRDVEMILARTEADFVSQAGMGDVLHVAVWPVKIGNTSWTFGYRVTNAADGRLVVKGLSVQVAFDYATNAKRAVPDAWRKLLEPGIAPAP